MVDLHAHILPGIDDGAADIEESLQMCRLAYQDGIRTIVATPHIGRFPNTREIILEKTEELKLLTKADNINITLLSGSDLEFSPEIFSLRDNKILFTINNSRYLLLDTPAFLLPPHTSNLIERLINKGIIPIISHPERCLQIQQDLTIVYDMISAGAVIQVTAASISGKMGSKAYSTALKMLKFSLIHLIATDMHGLNKRPPILSEAQEKAAKIIGRQDSLDMVTTTPLNIIEDKELNLPKPKRP